ncbi:MAG: secretin N-terminal domain-containing protein [Thermoanaerobaculia bacterium]
MRLRVLFRAAAVAGLIAVSGGFSAFLQAAEPIGVKVFVLKYKRIEEATLLVRPLLTDSGSIVLTSKINALTITDRPSALNLIAQALAQFDVPPRGYRIAVKLIRARADAPAGDLSREIGGIGNKLREVFRFNDYALVDSAVLGGAEGDTVSYLLGGEYRLGFRIEPVGQAPLVRFSRFSLSRERSDARGRKIQTPLYRTTFNIGMNQTMVVGASKEEGSNKALILILLVQEAPRPNAEKGASGINSAEAGH